MASYKRTINKKTNKVTYYVNGKRVDHEKFELLQRVDQCAGMQYNSSYTTSDNKYIRHYHSFS